MNGFIERLVGRARFALVVLGLTLAAAISPSIASAASGPAWVITSYTAPTNLPPGGTGEVIVTAVNVGGSSTDGSTITITDQVPARFTVTGVSGVDVYADGPVVIPLFTLPGAKLTCTVSAEPTCTREATVLPGDQLLVRIKVTVKAGAPESVVNQARVSGGGAPSSPSVSGESSVSSEPAKFGLAPGSVFTSLSSYQAGAHADVTTGWAANTTAPGTTSGSPKDVSFDLPPGAVGNTVGLPKCTAAEATRFACPANTIVGVATPVFFGVGTVIRAVTPIYNIEPSPGEPAAFIFNIATIPVRLDTSVLSDGNYAVRVTASNISQSEPVLGSYITVWGVPAEHNGPGPIRLFRASGAEGEEIGVESVGSPDTSASPVPMLSNPTQCGSKLAAFARADFWRAPGAFDTVEAPMEGLTGCAGLPFESSISLLPDTLEAGAPAGYQFTLNVNQQNSAGSPSTSDVKAVSLTMPEGVVVNPSAAWGLKACSPAQFYGPSHPSQEAALMSKCPREAQVGTVRVKTPALEEALEGVVYLAEPECDPCSPQDTEDGKMVKLFVQMVSEGEGGIVVKLEGHGMIDQKTGQITAVFDENPQLPFNEFKLKLAGGPRSVLANPRKCGTVKATGDLQPWSALESPEELASSSIKVSDSLPFYELEINQNCFGAQFNPSFVAGSPNIQAGAYTPFTLSFGRSDNDEFLSGIKQTMPPGLLGNLSSVTLCKEPEAAQGTCGAASLIGHVQVLTGPGADPFLVSGGQVFLTEGYEGAPYGLSIVVPAVAGPYTLSGTTGKGTVVVRAKIEVDPIDAHLTVTSDPLPTVLDGIPLQLKVVNVTIDRAGGFTFNPTSCAKMSIGGVLSSSEGMSATKSSSFQVTNCASLAFKPTFKASTSAKTSRTDGASLHVQLTYPAGSLGTEANIGMVKVELPKQLPSRLSTLQKACTAAQFNANPSGCPAASIVGHARATTPIIPVALEGPAYFVSHGGEAFPSLIVVLQGYGVSVDLVGTTFISKQGITSSTFKTVPDVPVGSFELTLPEGPFSALTNAGSLCKGTLMMPTTLQAQNGMVIDQATKIAVAGCPKAKKVAHKKRKATHKKKGKGKGRKASAGRGGRRG